MIRKVKVSSNAFDKLDVLLPVKLPGFPEEFTVQDFIDLELPEIINKFATEFDDLPASETQLPRYRYAIFAGLIIPKIVAFGFLHANNEISVLDLELNLNQV